MVKPDDGTLVISVPSQLRFLTRLTVVNTVAIFGLILIHVPEIAPLMSATSAAGPGLAAVGGGLAGVIAYVVRGWL